MYVRVLLEILRVGERPAAHGAQVGLFARVSPHVDVKKILRLETLLAHTTLVRSDSRVGLHVFRHRRGLGELLAAHFTRKGSFARVHPLVGRQASARHETAIKIKLVFGDFRVLTITPHRAIFARIRLLTHVSP